MKNFILAVGVLAVTFAHASSQVFARADEPINWAIQTTIPAELSKQIQKDSSQDELKNLWGHSINYDELAHGIIVDPVILRQIAALFKTPWIDDRTSHAGMEHTYGYLFSQLHTSFGYKRDRWTQGEIEAGFDLPRGVFSPEASDFKGTLFQNVTFFAGHIAFDDHKDELRVIEHEKRDVSPVLRKFEFSKLSPTRLEETISSPHMVLRTDLVPFIHPNKEKPDGDQYLLVYSIVTFPKGDASSEVKLITAFPVAQSMFNLVVNPENLGEGKSIQTRYNAFVEGVSGKVFTGSRKVFSK